MLTIRLHLLAARQRLGAGRESAANSLAALRYSFTPMRLFFTLLLLGSLALSVAQIVDGQVVTGCIWVAIILLFLGSAIGRPAFLKTELWITGILPAITLAIAIYSFAMGSYIMALLMLAFAFMGARPRIERMLHP